MSKVKDTLLLVLGALGFVAIAAGGFGSHVLGPHMTPEERHSWDLAVQFNLIHAAALMAVFAGIRASDPVGTVVRRLKRAFYLLTAGTMLFSGSIYAMGLGAPPTKVGPMTPVGGVTLMVGWLTVASAGF